MRGGGLGAGNININFLSSLRRQLSTIRFCQREFVESEGICENGNWEIPHSLLWFYLSAREGKI